MNDRATRKIVLQSGSILEIEHSDVFLQKVRQALNLMPDEDISDSDMRMFIYHSLKTALDKKGIV